MNINTDSHRVLLLHRATSNSPGDAVDLPSVSKSEDLVHRDHVPHTLPAIDLYHHGISCKPKQMKSSPKQYTTKQKTTRKPKKAVDSISPRTVTTNNSPWPHVANTNRPCSPVEMFVPRHDVLQSDITALTKWSLYLEAKLADVKEDHWESMLQITEHKNRELARIKREANLHHRELVRERREEEESSSHDIEVLGETIELMRENIQIMTRQNRELKDGIEQLEEENKMLREKTDFLYQAIAKMNHEIQTAEEHQAKLKEAKHFLKERKREYEHARREADLDICLESDQAHELRRKLVRILAEIDDRCPDNRLVDSIYTVVQEDLLPEGATVKVCKAKRAAPKRLTNV